MSFVHIKQRLTANPRSFDDLLEGENLSEFGFIGIKETTINLDIFAFVAADGLLNKKFPIYATNSSTSPGPVIPSLVLRSPFSLAALGSAMDHGCLNGILCFVFEKKYPESLSTFHQRTTKHTGQAGVIVPWSVDVANKRVYTHKNPVSIFPPVVIFDQFSFPNPDYIESFLSSYRTQAYPKQSRQSVHECTT